MAEFYTKAQIDAIATAIGQRIKALLGGGSGISILNFHSDASVNLTLTNQAATLQSLGNSNRNESYFDATGFTQVRLAARVVTASASTASPRLRIEYFNGSAWVIVGSDSGGDVISLGSAAAKRTNWIALPEAARADVIWRIAQIGGDAVADPAIGNTSLQFR
jgi:hypothetical protein